MRGLARAVVGLLQTGVDFTFRLGELAATRKLDAGTLYFGPGFIAWVDDHAACGYHAAAGKQQPQRNAPADGYQSAAKQSAAEVSTPRSAVFR